MALEFDVPQNAIPATLIIDRQGRIAAVLRKPVLFDELQPMVSELAAEGTDVARHHRPDAA